MGYILWGLGIAFLIVTVFKSSMIWVTALLLALALSFSLAHVCLYRPPEDHLGVIYRFARLSRLVDPDEWVFVTPGLDEIKEPVSLHLRRIGVNLSDLLTQDQVPVDCKLFVYYQLDLRCAAAHYRAQALGIPDEDWRSILRAVLQETSHEVVSGTTFKQLLTPMGRGHLKRTLAALLATRVRGLGLIINPRTGLSVQVLKPADAVWQAMVDRLAAVSLGEAAVARVRPMLEELSQRHPEVAWDAVLLEWAAAIAKDGAIPQVLVGPSLGLPYTVWQGGDGHEPISRADTRATASDLRVKTTEPGRVREVISRVRSP